MKNLNQQESSKYLKRHEKLFIHVQAYAHGNALESLAPLPQFLISFIGLIRLFLSPMPIKRMFIIGRHFYRDRDHRNEHSAGRCFVGSNISTQIFSGSSKKNFFLIKQIVQHNFSPDSCGSHFFRQFLASVGLPDIRVRGFNNVSSKK